LTARQRGGADGRRAFIGDRVALRALGVARLDRPAAERFCDFLIGLVLT
jgi:hypothetical protein